MVECIRFNSVVKGHLQGFADLYVEKWGLEIRGCSMYMKDGKRWINFPAKEFTTPEGEKAYAPHVKFRDKDNMSKFTEAAKKAIDDWCKQNPQNNEKTEEKPQFDDSECPF